MNITPILVMNIHNSVGLNICLYFRSYSPSLNRAGNKTKKNLSVLISFGLEKSVGLNILVESVLIFLVLVTGPVMISRLLESVCVSVCICLCLCVFLYVCVSVNFSYD
jgi:hypothetical protein